MANPHPTPRVVREQRLEPLQGLDIQVVGQLIADQPAGDLVASEVVAGQAGADPGTLVARSTFPMLYPVLAPERPPDGKPPAPTVVAGQAVPTLGPWWPGRRFRCFIRCLHRKGPRMASRRPQRSWPGKLRPPWDPGGQVDVSDALSGACTGKAPAWQTGPNGRGRASCRPPWDPGGQVDVSDALSGACTGKAPAWQTGPNGRGRASCAHPGTLVARSTFPMLYPVLAPERPPHGKPAPTVVAGQAGATLGPW